MCSCVRSNPPVRLTTRSADMDAREYVKRFRHRERFIGFCRDCPMYGRQYGCPPFDADPTDGCPADGTVTTWLTVIEPELPAGAPGLPLSLGDRLMALARDRVEPELLRAECQTGGRAFVGVGRCTRCGDERCSRLTGAPCRHPDVVRPSLEAAGFDVEAIARELFGVEIQWGADGLLPSRLHLVTALWHGGRPGSKLNR